MRLTLCLATFKRAAWIGETLAAILPQLTDSVEMVIVDGASPDDTEAVVRRAIAGYGNARYFREETNSGIDADYDKAVSYARGDYCWLVADDDLIVPDAVARVISALSDDPDLLIVDAEVRDVSLAHVLEPRRLPFSGERRYGPDEADRLMSETGNALSFIGCTVIRRERWLERDRATFYGSLFIHVGVVFQQPRLQYTKALGEPLVIIRLGNAMWTARSFEIWMFKWPELIWSFSGYSEAAKAAVTPREPWRLVLRLLLFRANGAFSREEYRHFFAGRRVGRRRAVLRLATWLPGRLANILAAFLLAGRGQGRTSGVYNLLACSPYVSAASRAIVRCIASPTWLETPDRR